MCVYPQRYYIVVHLIREYLANCNYSLQLPRVILLFDGKFNIASSRVILIGNEAARVNEILLLRSEWLKLNYLNLQILVDVASLTARL